jgi:hypothetical protein
MPVTGAATRSASSKPAWSPRPAPGPAAVRPPTRIPPRWDALERAARPGTVSPCPPPPRRCADARKTGAGRACRRRCRPRGCTRGPRPKPMAARRWSAAISMARSGIEAIRPTTRSDERAPHTHQGEQRKRSVWALVPRPGHKRLGTSRARHGQSDSTLWRAGSSPWLDSIGASRNSPASRNATRTYGRCVAEKMGVEPVPMRRAPVR